LRQVAAGIDDADSAAAELQVYHRVADPVIEDDTISHQFAQEDDYYLRFTNSKMLDDELCPNVFDRCYVYIDGRYVEAVVAGLRTTDVDGTRFVAFFMCYDKFSKLLGYFSSGRVTIRVEGWSIEDVSFGDAQAQHVLLQQDAVAPILAARADRIPLQQEAVAQESLCVVLTGTFPQLVGGTGLTLGKASLTKLVQNAGGRVVSSISKKTTHLVTGINPGQVKLQAGLKIGLPRIEFEPFMALLENRAQTVASAAPSSVAAAVAILPSPDPTQRPPARSGGWEANPGPGLLQYMMAHPRNFADRPQLPPQLDADDPARMRDQFDLDFDNISNPAKQRAKRVVKKVRRTSEQPIASALQTAATGPIVDDEEAERRAAAAAAAAEANQLKHFKLFDKRHWTVVEAGGAGNCFFYSILLLNKINHDRSLPQMPKTHVALRKRVVAHIRTNIETLVVCEQPIKSLLDLRSSSYLSSMNNDGKYVEYEIIGGFAHMVDTAVIVYSLHCAMPLVIMFHVFACENF